MAHNPCEYETVELPAINQLESMGWQYIDGANLHPENTDERSSLTEVVLEKRLSAAIQRINPWISDQNLHKVIRQITKSQYASLIEANEAIWQTMTKYLSVDQDLGNGRKNQTVKIIDFDILENNDFLAVNQFKVQGPNQNIIPDIVLFVNGLPLAVIECKCPHVTDPMESGIDQLLRYANRRNPSDNEGAEKLFHYNQFLVSTHRDYARIASITARPDDFLEWKDPYPLKISGLGSTPTLQETLIAGVFTKESLLDLIQNFTVFEAVNGKLIKKIARYQQFRAVHKALERIRSESSDKKDRGGVIWHTQGSGKSLTMVFLTLKLRRAPDLKDYKLVFLTDRTQLDGQLTGTFRNTQDETIHAAKSVSDLRRILKRKTSEIITSTVQKFQESASTNGFPEINDSEKIIVIADEAHRTQYGSLGAALNVGLPNAIKIAFTGTPLIKSQKTSSEFGKYIDTYTIEEAVKDGATVQLLYEGREAKVKVTGDSLDSLFDEYFSDKSDEEKQAIKDRYGTQQAILESPKRIRRICIDIIKHYLEKIEPNGFKAMIVTSSRNAAVTYKEMMDELKGPESAVIISGNHNDKAHLVPYTDPTKHKEQIKQFQQPLGTGKDQSNLAFLIVKDMLLTGFDAPIAQVMYLDRQLKDHTLLQAIARVNRKANNKFRGYIVDYFGLSDYLADALKVFSKEDVEGMLPNIADEAVLLKNAHTKVLSHFKGLKLNDVDACVLSLKDETKREEFRADFKRFSKQMDIVLPDPAANPYIADLKNLGKISIGARNMFRDPSMNVSGAGEKVKQLIEEHIISTGVDPKIPPVDLLDSDFKKKVNEHKSDEAKASEIESAIRHHIKVNLEEDPEYYTSLSKKLDEIIKQHQNKWELLVQMLFDFTGNMESERKKQAQNLGLSGTEYAFHNILMSSIVEQNPKAGVTPEDQQTSIQLTQELVMMMEKATNIVGFFEKWDEQKRVKKEIKRAVLRAGFDKAVAQSITDRFVELAEVKFK